MEISLATSDEGLLERAVLGDTGAFDKLVRARLDRMYMTANRILRDRAGAEDVVQQAMILAWRDLPSLRDRARFDAWLYRLLIRTCYRHLRSSRRWAANVIELAEIRASAPESTIHDRDALERAFRRLSAEKRSAIVLHHVTGFGFNEVSQVLGIPEGTVRSRIHYGLRELRQALAQDDALDPVEELA